MNFLFFIACAWIGWTLMPSAPKKEKTIENFENDTTNIKRGGKWIAAGILVGACVVIHFYG